MSHEAEIHEEHEEHVNHEAWVIPYADLLTLLMAMFIALFAMSTADPNKFKAVSLGLNQALGGDKLDTGVFASAKGNAPLSGTVTSAPASTPDAANPSVTPDVNKPIDSIVPGTGGH